MTTWAKNVFPAKAGRFWLWGIIWGAKVEKLYIIETMKVSNGYAASCDGAFLWESEIEGDYYITPMIEPDWPNSPNSEIIDEKFYLLEGSTEKVRKVDIHDPMYSD